MRSQLPSILNKKNLAQQNLIQRARTLVLTLITVFALHTTAYAAPETIQEPEIDTPVQILEVSQSAFTLETGEAKYMVLTLINLSEEEHSIELNVADKMVNLEKGIWQYDNTLEFSYEPSLSIPGRSIVRVPIDFKIPDTLTNTTFRGGITLEHTKSDGAGLDTRLLQPFKVTVLTPTAEAPLAVYDSLLHRYIFALLLLLGIPLICIAYEKTPYKRKFIAILAIFSIYSVHFIGTHKDNSFSHMVQHIQTDILEDFETAATEDVESNVEENQEPESVVEEILEEYEYKTEEGTSYIEANSTVVEGDEDLTFPYEEELTLNEPEINETTNGSEDIDAEIGTQTDTGAETGGTEDINIEAGTDFTETEETMATEDANTSIQAGNSTQTSGTVEETETNRETEAEEYLETANEEFEEIGAKENPEFGIEFKIERDNIYYKGTEMSALALLSQEKLSRQKIQYYTGRVLLMSDGGNARIQTRRICKIINKKNRNDQDIVKLQNAALKLLSNENVSFEKIQKYTEELFEKPKKLKKAQNICANLEDAHKEAREVLRKKGHLPKEKIKKERERTREREKETKRRENKKRQEPHKDIEETVATSDANYNINDLEETNVTPDADQIPATPNVAVIEETGATESIEAASSDTVIEEDPITEIASTTDEPEETESTGEEFTLYDSPDQIQSTPETEETNNTTQNELEEVETENTEQVIELDLTRSQVVEIDIPDLIQLPPLTRQEESYTAKYSMGKFQMKKFNEASNWNGFFTFDVIQLNDGQKLNRMWLDINGHTIHPEESLEERDNFLHYEISDKLFSKQDAGTYLFSPNINLWVPSKAYPGQYSSDISFTIIQ